MDLLILMKCFLTLGCICYILFVYNFVTNHMPKIKLKEKKDKKDKEKVEEE